MLGVLAGNTKKHAIEAVKNVLLKKANDDLDKHKTFSPHLMEMIQWWPDHALECPRPLMLPPVTKLLQTDAIWNWLLEKRCWAKSHYLPGKDNEIADGLSRKSTEGMEWMLDVNVFRAVCEKMEVQPVVDLFASPSNAQLDIFYTFEPHNAALGTDAFLYKWSVWNLTYAFPPFSVMDGDNSLGDNAYVAYSPMVVQHPSVIDQRFCHAASQLTAAMSTNSTIQETPAAAQNPTGRLSLVGMVVRARGLSETAGKILLAGWKLATICQYDTQLAEWQQFCIARDRDPYSVSEDALMNFLATLEDKKLKESTIAKAKAAVLNLWLLSDGVKLESHVLSLFM